MMSDSLRSTSSPFSWSFGILIATVAPSFSLRANQHLAEAPFAELGEQAKPIAQLLAGFAAEHDQRHDYALPRASRSLRCSRGTPRTRDVRNQELGASRT